MEAVLAIGFVVVVAVLLIRFRAGGRSNNRSPNRNRRAYWSDSVDSGSYDSGGDSGSGGHSSSCGGGSSSSCGGGGCGGGSS